MHDDFAVVHAHPARNGSSPGHSSAISQRALRVQTELRRAMRNAQNESAPLATRLRYALRHYVPIAATARPRSVNRPGTCGALTRTTQ
jgi:hypothetical protein